ncbi:MAG: N-acetylglucosamine-6-phosphate deacetylase [Candidatus Aureabacteria bacterium]|nr:N-acetylglucosamine-6-phosphate deacetylase [Candidatus Auribacterota bacterium]
MADLVIKNISVFQENGFRRGTVFIRNGRIKKCDFSRNPEKPSLGEEAAIINGRGNLLLPGMIDIHFHGTGGADSSKATEAILEKMENSLLCQGVTGFLPTFYSIPFSLLEKNLQFYRGYLRRNTGKTSVLGVNLEGPFLNKKQGGSHDKKLLTDFSDTKYVRLIREYRDIIRIITVAPELRSAMKHIRQFSQWGIRVMLGHTLATCSESRRAFSAGASGITHFYNRITPFHHREVGLIGAAFLDRDVYVELIADGLHSSPEALQIAFKNIHRDRIIIVSDSIVCPEKVKVIKGLQGCRGYVDSSNNFVGGGSSLLSSLKHVIKNMGMDLEKAWGCASLNPAVFLGEEKNYGSIRPGRKADLVILDQNLGIRTVIKSGEIICAA